MKQFVFAVSLLFIRIETFAGFIPPDSVRSVFTKVYPEARDVRWYKSDEGFQVYFLQKAVRTKLYFDRSGKIEKSLRYYGEGELPPYLRMKIQQRFQEQTISGITEVTDQDGVLYHIVLENATSWLEVAATAAGQLDVTLKMRKG